MPVLYEIDSNVGVALMGMECMRCGSVFAMTKSKYSRCNDDKEEWYCPNGHRSTFGQTTVSKLEEKLALERRKSDTLQMDLKYSEDQVRSQKAAKTRLKNRIANGVCPCCNRSFQNLHRHMKSKHPDFSEKPIIKTKKKRGRPAKRY